MSKKLRDSNRSFFIALGLFILGIISLIYGIYVVTTNLGVLTLPLEEANPGVTMMKSMGAIGDSHPGPTSVPKVVKECQKGNIFSCAKEAFGWDHQK